MQAWAGAAPDTNSERKVAVLPIRVEGQADDATRREWTNGLRRGIGRGDFQVADQAKVDQLGDPACERKSCWEKIRGATRATHIVRTSVSIKNRDYSLKLELLDTETGAVVVSTEDRCEICGVEEVGNLLDSQGALLQTKLAAMGKGPPVLVIASKPSGALVYVDGEVVGTTPLERPVLEGTHRVRVSLDGHLAEEREISFVAGVREQIDLDLQRTPGNPKKRALGGAALGGGIALIGGGLALLAAEHARDFPYKRNCEQGKMTADDMGDCKYLLDLSWGGAALTAAGAVLVTLGVMALVRNRGAKPSRQQAQVFPAGFGVVGRF